MALEITDANVRQLLADNKYVVVDFWAEWCGPCKAVSPIVSELAEKYKDSVAIGKYNVDEGEDFVAEYAIRSIPTLIFFKDGQPVDKHVGSLSKEALDEKIQHLMTL